MSEEEIKKIQEQVKTLTTQVETLTKENGEFKTSNTKLGEDMKQRDEAIAKMKQDAQKRGEEFKKFRDMTDAEKELLSEKEKEIILRTEKMEEERELEKKTQAEVTQKQRESMINRLATTMAKGNKDLAEQIKINLGKLNPELISKAITEEDLAPHIDSAFKMTGVTNTADPIRTAHNAEGGNGPIKSANDFADTKTGKDLASAMGLSQATPDGQKAVESAGGGEVK